MKKTVFVLFLTLILISSGFAGGRSQSGASSSGTGGAQVITFLMGKDDPLKAFRQSPIQQGHMDFPDHYSWRPPLILFIFFNKKIVSGIAAGAVKG